MQSYALPAGFALVTGYLLQWSDRLILAAYVPPAKLGAYSAAGDLALQGMGLLFSAFHLAWFPRWSRPGSAVASKSMRCSRAICNDRCGDAAVHALGFVLVAPDLAQVLLGGAYRADAARVMPWFALSALLAGLRCYVFDVQLNLTQRMTLLSRRSASARRWRGAEPVATVPLLRHRRGGLDGGSGPGRGVPDESGCWPRRAHAPALARVLALKRRSAQWLLHAGPWCPKAAGGIWRCASASGRLSTRSWPWPSTLPGCAVRQWVCCGGGGHETASRRGLHPGRLFLRRVSGCVEYLPQLFRFGYPPR